MKIQVSEREKILLLSKMEQFRFYAVNKLKQDFERFSNSIVKFRVATYSIISGRTVKGSAVFLPVLQSRFS